VAEWQERAACKGHPEAWIFDATIRDDPAVWLRAGHICAKCPVSTECAEWAQTEREYDGIAAGWVWRPRADGKSMKWTPCVPL
jgi:hypothetical protein